MCSNNAERFTLGVIDGISVFPVPSPLNLGHVIVAPTVPKSSLKDFTDQEYSQLWRAARRVAQLIAVHVLKDPEASFTYHLSDINASLKVPSKSSYCHVIPRCKEDFVPNDKIYERLNVEIPYELARDECFTETEIADMVEYKKKLLPLVEALN